MKEPKPNKNDFFFFGKTQCW